MTQQTKDDAREEAIRRWRALPADERQTTEQADYFAAALADTLDFRTMGNRRRVILGWLVRELAGLPAWGHLPPESIQPYVPPAAPDDSSEIVDQVTEQDLPDDGEEMPETDADDDANRHAAE